MARLLGLKLNDEKSMYMNKSTKKKLMSLSYNKMLFKQGLSEIIKHLDKDGQFDLLLYCYKNYSDIHPDVLYEIFSDSRTGLSAGYLKNGIFLRSEN